MSGIAGIFGTFTRTGAESTLHEMAIRMARRGRDWREVRSLAGGGLAVCRNTWEGNPSSHGDVGVLREGAHAVVADAAIYYRQDLVRDLSRTGHEPQGSTPSHLILAAYRAWGQDFVGRLEGDFAFVLWDELEGRATMARGGDGSRPLFYAASNGGLAAASTIDALLAHPDCRDDFDLAELAAIAIGNWSGAEGTGYREVHLLPCRHTLSWAWGEGPRTELHWAPPLGQGSDGLSLDAAATRLRELLIEATGQRMDPQRPTGVWMSGGVDSPSVFAAGREWLHRRRPGDADVAFPHALRPVSVSYPPGDPGREDELIQRVAQPDLTPIEWLPIEDIPLFPRDPISWAAERDDPFTHPFEEWNRALARSTRATGSRISFTGFGGDQLFHLSPVHLADLLRSGRLPTLVRERRWAELSGFTDLLQHAILPALPPALHRTLRRASGDRIPGSYLEDAPATWFRDDFLRAHAIIDRERPWLERRWSSSPSDNELGFYLHSPFFSRILMTAAGLSLEEGVELRSPLFDRRIIEFACRRPWSHRRLGPENKRVLRHAMENLLPLELLLPRPGASGVTSGYLDRGLRQERVSLITDLLERPILAELGMVEPALLQRAWERHFTHGGGQPGIRLLLTIRTELWLRARLGELPLAHPDRQEPWNRTGSRRPGTVGSDASGTVYAKRDGQAKASPTLETPAARAGAPRTRSPEPQRQ